MQQKQHTIDQPQKVPHKTHQKINTRVVKHRGSRERKKITTRNSWKWFSKKEENKNAKQEKEKAWRTKKDDSSQKIYQQELFEMKDIPLSNWQDSSKSSDYVPESTPSSDNIQSESQTKKYTKRPRKKWINIFIVDLKKKLFDINNFWLLCYLDLTIFTK